MNPQTFVNEPDYAPGTDHGLGFLILVVIASYVFFFWLLFKGPLRHWAQEHTGGAYLVLVVGPWLPIFLAIAAR